MFETAYTFHLVDHKKIPDGGMLESWMYNFRTKKRRYIVKTERYQWEVYAIKYYAACHAPCKNKYKLLLNDEQPAPIIRTCADIMLLIFASNPRASFGFVGSPSVNKKKKGLAVTEAKSKHTAFQGIPNIDVQFFRFGDI